MAKGPKLRLSFLNSIQICRVSDPSTLVKTPLPQPQPQPHISKTYDISLPTFPDPPSSPNHQHQPKSHSTTKREDKQKLKEEKKHGTDMKKVNSSKDHYLPSPLPSSNKSDTEPLNTSEKSMRRSSVRTRRFKRYGSKDWEEGSKAKLDDEQSERLLHRQVNESFVVLKRSADPYQDFKSSMLEMIVERRIFEPRDLEQLLMSFLSLNSRVHHKAILKAFSEIWKEVFSAPLS